VYALRMHCALGW